MRARGEAGTTGAPRAAVGQHGRARGRDADGQDRCSRKEARPLAERTMQCRQSPVPSRPYDRVLRAAAVRPRAPMSRIFC